MQRITAGIVVLVCGAILGLAAKDYLFVKDELPELRQTLSAGASLDEDGLRDAAADLERIADSLEGFAFSALRIVPIVRENIDAARDIARASVPVIETTLDVQQRLDADTLVDDGTVRLDRIDELRPLIEEQHRNLTVLRRSATGSLNGLLLPSIWNDVTEVARRTLDLEQSVALLEEGVARLPDLLGGEERRRYGVLLLNNAEQRGAGGIVSAIGSIDFSEGAFEVGKFRYYRDLDDAYPYRRVPAPRDLRKRFGRYWADTTLWINTSASPDVPEVAEVAARLIDLTVGHEVQGVLLIDAHGLAAFLDPDDDIDTDLPGVEIDARELPKFVHSDAYEIFESNDERRAALLALAPAVLDEAREEVDVDTFRRLADASGAGHVRFVSLDEAEKNLLVEAGIAGELTTDAADSVLFTLQNLGADKLDYWIDRKYQHACVATDQTARCRGTVSLTNEAPDGLAPYVSNFDRSRGYEGYAELYLDDDAELTSFGIDGNSVEPVDESEDGRQALGLDVEIPQGDTLVIGYSYDLPLEGSYTLEIAPQPVARPARLDLSVRIPEGWMAEYPRGRNRGSFFDTDITLDRTIEVRAGPAERRGLSRFWDGLVEFWREPL